ncbi:multicopper oxidase family protein [Parafrankia sp. EUN1f]|uniref:multicopper oxidase family protein n=1 Tax=Parafrankia sp. EUN1f TaxID=102897 RepID=UPI0001C45E6A|nr:multicopper oxidase family protein [Parafrankia sp. EUN1f]EFC82767.1 Bilirubin oxidase [Parafrankia sp. EUN1f]
MARPLSRRTMLGAGAWVAATVTGGVALTARGGDGPAAAGQAGQFGPAGQLGTGHRGPAGHLGHGGLNVVTVANRAPATSPFSVPLPVPPVLAPSSTTSDTDTYDITSRAGQEELLPGHPAEVLGYNGTYIGPTIRARVGRRVVVRHRNELTKDTAVHLHGAHTLAASDGFPTDVIAPGAARAYEYPNEQPATTLWYHDHAHHNESEHIYRGLHGFYLLEDPAEASLGLPSGDFDIPVMLSDATFDADGQLVYALLDEAGRTTLLTNGRPAPYFEVQARKYRFRLLNAANMRIFDLVLGRNEEFTQIAGDGGLLPVPARVRALRLSPAERVDIVIDFSRYQPGTQLQLTNTRNLLDPAAPVSQPVLRFDVVAATGTDTSRVPTTLTSLPALAPATRVRDVVLAFDTVAYSFVLNGKVFDPNRVDFRIRRGTTEIWRITNPVVPVAVYHNLHLHLVQFRVLDRNGAPPGPGESGWKDTVLLAPGETVRVQATFSEYLGKFVYHCHAVDHASIGMMAVFETYA